MIENVIRIIGVFLLAFLWFICESYKIKYMFSESFDVKKIYIYLPMQ